MRKLNFKDWCREDILRRTRQSVFWSSVWVSPIYAIGLLREQTSSQLPRDVTEDIVLPHKVETYRPRVLCFLDGDSYYQSPENGRLLPKTISTSRNFSPKRKHGFRRDINIKVCHHFLLHHITVVFVINSLLNA